MPSLKFKLFRILFLTTNKTRFVHIVRSTKLNDCQEKQTVSANCVEIEKNLHIVYSASPRLGMRASIDAKQPLFFPCREVASQFKVSRASQRMLTSFRNSRMQTEKI